MDKRIRHRLETEKSFGWCSQRYGRFFLLFIKVTNFSLSVLQVLSCIWLDYFSIPRMAPSRTHECDLKRLFCSAPPPLPLISLGFSVSVHHDHKLLPSTNSSLPHQPHGRNPNPCPNTHSTPMPTSIPSAANCWTRQSFLPPIRIPFLGQDLRQPWRGSPWSWTGRSLWTIDFGGLVNRFVEGFTAFSLSFI